VNFGAIASDYDEFVGAPCIHRAAIPSILSLRAAGDAVLDVACGQGVLTQQLARRFRLVVGVDRTPELIGIAKERSGAPHVRYLTEDAERLSGNRWRARWPDGQTGESLLRGRTLVARNLIATGSNISSILHRHRPHTGQNLMQNR
jgi:SAM-dependent methyltransferase